MSDVNAVASPVGIGTVLPGCMVVVVVDVTSKPMDPMVPFDGMSA